MRIPVLVLTALIGALPASAANGLMGGGPFVDTPTNDITSTERATANANVARFEALHGPGPLSGPGIQSTTPQLYPFIPQGGTVWDDLFINNYVDLDPTSPGILDWDCTDWTYDGHTGYDIIVRSFGYSDIGVPIFAALDGTVSDAHDGEWDRESSSINGAVANYVILSHGNTQYTLYWHMRKGSVAVKVGDVVKAGQQLGLTGSSGFSTAPHLHFESQIDNAVFDPSTGSCNPRPTNWVHQIPVRRDMWVEEVGLSNAFLDTYPGIPWDQPRCGTFIQGSTSQNISLWMILHNQPANSTYRLQFIRPDGTVAADGGTGNFNNSTAYRYAWWWFRYFVTFDTVGTWHAQMSLNGQVVYQAPFTVVSSFAQEVNRPPSAVTASFDPAAPGVHDVVFCRVNPGTLFQDPDYDIVRYHYVWTVNGVTIRDFTGAGHADAVPHDVAHAGDVLKCVVTPSDGVASAASTTVTYTYPLNIAGDVDGNGTFNTADVAMAVNIAGGKQTGTVAEVGAGHLDGSGPLTLTDAVQLSRKLYGF